MGLELSARVAALPGADLLGLAWLLTYSFHAAVWASAVLLLMRSRLPSTLRHAAWKVALFGPLLTSVLALVLRSPDNLRALTAHVPEIAVVSLRPVNVGTNAATNSPGFLASVLLAAVLFGLLRHAFSALQLRRHLRHRRPVKDARLLAGLAKMRARFALRAIALSESTAIDCPLVIGVAEICIPQATLVELSEPEIEAVFAHELAHLERHDGIWFPLVGLLNATLWWHPLTRWVCVQVRQSAERACDDRCVLLTGEPLALARALARIAARALAIEPAWVLPTMTHPRSGLVARVAHLTSGMRPVEHSGSARMRVGLVVGFAVLTAGSVGSGVRVAAAGPAAPRAYAAIDAHTLDLSRQMNALALRQQLLETELQTLLARSAGPNALQSDSVRALEIEQELRHVREMQVWVEARLVNP
jgi:beta-lactamase regulating signal transducer with metallopeptidase domain